MKDEIKLLLAFGFFFLLVSMHTCSSEASPGKRPDVGLWLARSCAGEAGFDSGLTGECAAIMHLYLKRTKVSGFNMLKVVKKYSAAVKARPNHPRKWILKLSRDLKKPKGWNERTRWLAVRSLWMELLWYCDDFLAGKVPDPLPKADHYGGSPDRDRARRAGWFKLKTDFRNDFWSITDPKKKVIL